MILNIGPSYYFAKFHKKRAFKRTSISKYKSGFLFLFLNFKSFCVLQEKLVHHLNTFFERSNGDVFLLGNREFEIERRRLYADGLLFVWTV